MATGSSQSESAPATPGADRQGEVVELPVPAGSKADSGRSSRGRVVRSVMALLAAGFVLAAARDLYKRWDGQRVSIEWPYLVCAFALSILAMLFQLQAWRALIFGLTGRHMPRRASARLYLDSQIARYTPGKVGLLVVRTAGAERVGVETQVLGASLLVEVVSWCGVGSLVGSAVFSWLARSSALGRLLSAGSLLVSALIFAVLVVLTTVSRSRYPGWAARYFPAISRGPVVPWAVPGWHLLHYAAWIGCGAFLGRAVGGGLQESLAVGALLCVAIVAGFLAFLAPAGAGVREAVLAAGTAPLLGPAAGLTVSLLARAISLLSDVSLWVWFRARDRG